MIVKKIPARAKGRAAARTRSEHAQGLVDYLRLPEKESAEKDYMVAYMLEQELGDTSGERLFHIAGRGFVSTSIEGQRAEMIAVANEARRSPNPIDHWLLSWQEGELPSPEQVDDAVALFASHLGVEHLPHIYACHGDTHNRHVHIALNRFDMPLGRMIEINDGWTLEAAHQAVALIVDRFGWRPEPEARYVLENGKPVLSASALAAIAEGKPPIGQQAAALENRTGYRSAQRIAQDEAAPLMRAATSWEELHASLAAAGMTYERSGTNGAKIRVGTDAVKSSDIGRGFTPTALERRLGAFESGKKAITVASRDPKSDRFPEAIRAEEYREEREAWTAWKNTQKALKALQGLGKPTLTELGEQVSLQCQRKPAKAPPPPNYESWCYAHNEGVFADRWRNRRTVSEYGSFAGTARGASVAIPPPEAYLPFPCDDGVRYAVNEKSPTAFLDRGRRVDVVLEQDSAMLAAFRLAADKFGQVSVSGSPAFREKTYALVVANGMGHLLKDPDLAQRFREGQEEKSRKAPLPGKTSALPKLFEQAAGTEFTKPYSAKGPEKPRGIPFGGRGPRGNAR